MGPDPIPPTARRRLPTDRSGLPAHVRRWFGGRPGADTAIAALTLVGLWGCYFLGAGRGISWVLYAGILVFGTALPAWAISRSGARWADLGLTRRRLVVSLVAAPVLGGASLPRALGLAGGSGVDVLTQFLANAVVLWEPFFVFGWLYLRWEKAFGIVAAVVLAGAGFALQHLGSVPPAQALSFGVFGLVIAAIFALTRNLAILWPLFYPVASTIGTLQAGFVMGWGEIVGGAALLLVQAVVIVVLMRRRGRDAPAAGCAATS